MKKFVLVRDHNGETIHGDCPFGSYDTLCGFAATEYGEKVVTAPPNSKINCQTCEAIIRASWKYKPNDLTE